VRVHSFTPQSGKNEISVSIEYCHYKLSTDVHNESVPAPYIDKFEELQK